MFENKAQGQPFYTADKVVHQGKPNGVCRAAEIKGCVTSSD
jgi:hypothetical protein